MSTLHQIWIGSTMPDKYRAWCDSMQAMAEERGMVYHLANWEEVAEQYADNPVMPLLKAALDVLPTGTTYALISDWWRLRILADSGGWYADTDFEARVTPGWQPSADLHMFDEGTTGPMLAAGMMIANGRRGQDCASFMAHAAEEGLVKTLGSPTAADFARRYIELVRTDTPGRKWSLVHVIGNAVINRDMLPALRSSGYTIAPIPHEVASNSRYVIRYGKPADLWHWGTGSWVNRDPSYWPSIARKAKSYDHAAQLSRLPAHLRPQGVPATIKPKVYHRKQEEPDQLTLRALLNPPRAAKRIVVFSNILRGFPDFELSPGDFCVHCNTARHLPESLRVPGTSHTLLIRHGADMKWYGPDSVDGVQHVSYINPGSPIYSCSWYKQYVSDNPHKHPTTGYVAAQLCRQLAPGTPLLLVGFDPLVNHGTSRWEGHAWQYEAMMYRLQGFNLIKPRRTTRCRILVGVCSCQQNTDRREACRASWLRYQEQGIITKFFAAGTVQEQDLVNLPVPDDYDHLPEKVLAFFRYALRHYSFDWLFKCDDDTYLALDRLASICTQDADFIGDRPISAGFVSGGAGYLLQRKVVEELVAHAATIPLTGAEDVQITQAVYRLGFRAASSHRLKNNHGTAPAASNDQVTCTQLTPEEMLTIDHRHAH